MKAIKILENINNNDPVLITDVAPAISELEDLLQKLEINRCYCGSAPHYGLMNAAWQSGDRYCAVWREDKFACDYVIVCIHGCRNFVKWDSRKGAIEQWNKSNPKKKEKAHE